VRFLLVTEQGGRYVSQLAEGPPPIAREGEVLIHVTASGLNRADLSQIAGRYPPPPGESAILGIEVSGTLDQTEERVCALLAGGGDAEYVAAPIGQVFPAPTALDLVAAAGIPEAFIAAFLDLVVEAGLAHGGTVLVHAGASGVGLAAIQVAKYLGARVAATTRTRAKIPALVEAGAELALDTSTQDFAIEIERRWGPNAVDIVLDPVGATTMGGDLRVLAVGGHVVYIATMGGADASLDLSHIMRKRARLVGSMLRSRSRAEKAALVARFRDVVLPGFASGALTVPIDSVFPPERAAEGFQRMRDNKNTGKIVIDWRRA
jgi:putative PIG3 family NAD(P)H quinone oxidoreductase